MLLRVKSVIFLLLSSSLWILQPAYGHGDLHERILAASQEIETHPDSAFLYLKRGELYYQHIEYKKAIKDFKTCSRYGHVSTRLSLGYAKAYKGMGKLNKAKEALFAILFEDEKDVRALRLLGSIFFKMERYEEAAKSFEKVILYADKTFTENYLEASFAWEKVESPLGMENAMKVIKTGIHHLGHLMVFYDRLVELSLKNQDYANALVYQNKLIELSNRKERVYYQRAKIQVKKGDKVAAKEDLDLATQAIEKLPARLKNIKSIKELESDIQTLLNSL